MFARELPDGTVMMIEQEDHTDLSAQFAAHWGNAEFSKLKPYHSMLFGTIYHDSGHREMEADLPIDVERGVPYAIGRTPAGVRRNDADLANAQWVRTRDPYASLIVAMHHAGLRKNRYDTVRKRANGGGSPTSGKTLGIDDAFADMDTWQREVAEQLGLNEPGARKEFWHNYRMLQVFDLLSLYFCRDGIEHGQMQEVTLEQVPVRSGDDRVVDLHIVPTGSTSLRITPYPLDVDPLPVCMMTRIMTPVLDEPELVTKEAYYKARRYPLACEITS